MKIEKQHAAQFKCRHVYDPAMEWIWVQFAPGNPAEVLVTSADSQIRVFDGVTMVQKFRGAEGTTYNRDQDLKLRE